MLHYNKLYALKSKRRRFSYGEMYGDIVETKIVIEAIPKKSKLLDIGCGNGRISSFLAEKGVDVIGIDLSVVGLKIAKKACMRSHFLVADIKHLPFRDQMFDFALLLGTLEYFKNLREPLGETYRVVKKGGHVLFNTWNKCGKRFRTVSFNVSWRFINLLKRNPPSWLPTVPKADFRAIVATSAGIIAHLRSCGFTNHRCFGNFFLLPKDVGFLCALFEKIGANRKMLLSLVNISIYVNMKIGKSFLGPLLSANLVFFSRK